MDRDRKFFLLSKDNLNGLNGSAKFIKVLSGDKSFWKSKKIDVMVFSNSGTFSCAENYRKTIKFKIKQYIKWFLDCSIWGKRLKLRHTVFLLGGNVIRNIKEKLDYESWIEETIFCNVTKIVFVSENSKNYFCEKMPEYAEKA